MIVVTIINIHGVSGCGTLLPPYMNTSQHVMTLEICAELDHKLLDFSIISQIMSNMYHHIQPLNERSTKSVTAYYHKGL